MKKCPAHPTPTSEVREVPRGAMRESGAISQDLRDEHGPARFYPTDLAKRAAGDRAMLRIVGALHPPVARATDPALGFPPHPGEIGASEAAEPDEDEARPRGLAVDLRAAGRGPRPPRAAGRVPIACVNSRPR
jgi:glutathione S-transferase